MEPVLTPEGENTWLRLKKHIEWTEDFFIGFIFSRHPAVLHIFRERLAAIFHLRVTRLQFVLPDNPEELTGSLLGRLVKPHIHDMAHSGPVWLDLSAKCNGEWHEAAIDFIARLNEHRETLRRSLGKPLILIFSTDIKEEIRGMAPDLWAIRAFSIDTSADLITNQEEPAPPPERAQRQPLRELNEYEQSILTEWERVRSSGVTSRGGLASGFRAVDVLLRVVGDAAAAENAARYILTIARKNASETPESLRDISVSLDNVGKTVLALGEYEQARTLYDESLAISRRILERIGETPESLRDLSVSLDNVGQTVLALGDMENARKCFKEGLAIGRELAASLPDISDYAKLPAYFSGKLAQLDSSGADIKDREE